MDTFTPPSTPTVDTTVTFNSNVIQAGFGDGYEQTAVQGLNPVAGVYSVVFDLLARTDRDTIEAFFGAHQGAQAFLYTMPDELTPRKFKVKTWTRSSNGGLYSLKADFREVFDLS